MSCAQRLTHGFCQSVELYQEERNMKNHSEGGSHQGVRKTFYADEKWRFIKDMKYKTGYKLNGFLKYFVYVIF